MSGWTTPPAFATHAVLSAAQLNVLSADLEYLNGFVTGANPAMVATTLTVDGDIRFVIRHLHRYLHTRIRATDDVKIDYDTIRVYHNGDPGPDDIVFDIDLDSFELIIGQLYTLKFEMNGTGNRTVYYAYENESAT